MKYTLWLQTEDKNVLYSSFESENFVESLYVFLVVNKKQFPKYWNQEEFKSLKNSVVFFPSLVYLSFYKYINFKQFWILVLIWPGMATKSWWGHMPQSHFEHTVPAV